MPGHAAVASIPPPVRWRQGEAQPAAARTQLAGTFGGIGNTPQVRLRDVARDYMALHPGPMHEAAFAAYATRRGVTRLTGLSSIVDKFSGGAPVAPPPRKTLPVRAGRAMKAAIEWHDLSPKKRVKQTIGRFALDHGCTANAVLHWVDRKGLYRPRMEQRLQDMKAEPAAATRHSAHLSDITSRGMEALEPEFPVELGLSAEQQATLTAALFEVLRSNNGRP